MLGREGQGGGERGGGDRCDEEEEGESLRDLDDETIPMSPAY